MALLTEEHRAWIGQSEEPVHVDVNRSDIVKYSVATEQRQAKYLAGDEAPLMFIFNLFGSPQPVENLRPDGLPRGRSRGPTLPLKRVMAGGTDVEVHKPIKPGDRLTGVSSIVDLYEKDGSQGPLIFTVRRLQVTDANGEPVYTETQTSIAR